MNLPADSVAFVAALNECIHASPLLHPVCGRNADILGAWGAVAPRIGHGPALIGDERVTFRGGLELISKSLVLDPLYPRVAQGKPPGFFDVNCVLAAAAAMFWGRRNAIIETTEALERILADSDLGDDLPAGLLRPPFPATYLRFGDAFRQAAGPAPRLERPDLCHLQGVYVFETVHPNKRAMTLVPIFILEDTREFAANALEIGIDDEAAPLDQLVQQVAPRDGVDRSDHFVTLAGIVVKVFLYMDLAETVRAEERHFSFARERLDRIGPKKAAKLQRQLHDLYDRIVLGPQEIHAPVHGHGEVSPHLRRGHFRMQPHGPKSSLRKVIFMAPTWIRADRLAKSPEPVKPTTAPWLGEG
jgi:hypothetical protein